MTEPLDDDDCRASWSDPIHDEIKKLTGDNRALRMILKDCRGELLKYQRTVSKHSNLDRWAQLEMLVQQIDDELKSE
jgi:hypothetical protein